MEFKIENYDEELKELEKLFYETNASAEIVALLINKQMKNTEAFDQYWIEYLNLFIKYQHAKNKFSNEVVSKYIQGPVNWNIDFENKVCKIE